MYNMHCCIDSHTLMFLICMEKTHNIWKEKMREIEGTTDDLKISGMICEE